MAGNDLRNTSPAGAAESGAVPTSFAPADPDLNRLVDAWPTLPAPVRAAILELVEGTASTDKNHHP
jgi:hypothetical protein